MAEMWRRRRHGGVSCGTGLVAAQVQSILLYDDVLSSTGKVHGACSRTLSVHTVCPARCNCCLTRRVPDILFADCGIGS